MGDAKKENRAHRMHSIFDFLKCYLSIEHGGEEYGIVSLEIKSLLAPIILSSFRFA